MLGYEGVLKQRGLIGNLTISVLVGLLFIFGAAVVGEFGIVIFLFLLAFLATLAREIVKDIEDIKGDLDRKTLPKSIGVSSAGVVAAAVLIIAIILSPIPAFDIILELLAIEAGALSVIYLALIVPADILFIMSMFNFTKNPHRASTLLKAGMFVSLLAFALGSFSI
jgi:geranylgeranylglycerol-phosphate geranylgeranyltransferase